MPNPTTLSRVHAWATANTNTLRVFTVHDVTMNLIFARHTALSALEALEEMGFADQVDPGHWQVKGTAQELADVLTERQVRERKSAKPLKPYEGVRDVFDYAARCAQQEQ